ncbi:ephrin-A5b-like isoform X2 [Hyla sarda]|uniref:ephrin-A5b-like isoform X2 n=1 Tax=Hyla sarda TaxID=327740 RepID=UPI0024C278AC|nr:ephrin-A5b-like isoform X2 [Hyla sarda]
MKIPWFLKADYTVHVAINDYLEIYCPHYDPHVPEERTENFVLYMVDGEDYGGCSASTKASKRWECNRPHAPAGPVKFSEKIHRFTPFSSGTDFREGQDYYYISIPLSDSVGECLKLRLSVCCRATTKPVTAVPKSQPRGGELAEGDPRRRSGSSSPPAL